MSYITLSLVGLNMDKLLNLLKDKDINLKGVKRPKYNQMQLTISEKDYQQLTMQEVFKPYEITILSYSGVASIKRKFTSFIGLSIGLICAVILCIVLSLFTFDIKVYGTNSISRQDIQAVLSSNGIKLGSMAAVDCNKVEQILLSNFDNISLISVTKKGTTLIINIKEKVVLEDYVPIYAQDNMLITSIQVTGGTSMVKVGDIVKKGDMLIDCFSTINGNRVKTKPIGVIYADVYKVGEVEFLTNEVVKVRTGNKFVYKYYDFMGVKILQTKKDNPFAMFDKQESLTKVFNNFLLPLTLHQTIYYELKETTITRNFEENKDKLIAQSKNLAYSKLEGLEALEESLNIFNIGDHYYVQTYLKVNKRVL